MIHDLHVATIEALASDQPVVMLNLMKFRDESLEANVHRDNGCEAHLIMATDETYNGLAG